MEEKMEILQKDQKAHRETDITLYVQTKWKEAEL